MSVPSGWRLAPCLEELRSQVDQWWPNRSQASDGTVADSHHSPASDHWPHPAPALGSGLWVTAEDITHDPSHGVWTDLIADALIGSHDPRIKYVISFGRIASNPAYSHPADNWRWRPYDGTDQHRNHVHVSVLDAQVSASRALWPLTVTVHNAQREDDMLYQITQGGSLAGAPQGTDYRNIYIGTKHGPVVITPDEWSSLGNAAPMRVGSWARLVLLCPPDVPATVVPGTEIPESMLRQVVREEVDTVLTNTHFHVDPIV